jgi:predicted transcriptional regulator
MLEKFLLELGLSEKEAKIYMALLEVDTDSVSDLAKKTGINRTTVYPVLDSLQQKKLVKETKVKGKTRYMAESPDRLETYVEQQKLKLNELENRVHDMIPQFKGVMRGAGERPIVEYHEGRQAILDSVKRYYKRKGEDQDNKGYLLYPRHITKKIFTQKELTKAGNLTVKNNVDLWVINTLHDEDPKDAYKRIGNEKRIVIDKEKYPIKADLSVYGDEVRIHTLGDPLGTLYIKSKDIADTVKVMFKMIFDLRNNK